MLNAIIEIGLLLVGIVEIGLTIWLAAMSRKTAQIDKLSDQLSLATEKQVETALGDIRSSIHRIEKRLDKGDAAFDDADRQKHEIELKVVEKISAMKEWMSEQFAHRNDVEKYIEKCQALSERIAAMAERN